MGTNGFFHKDQLVFADTMASWPFRNSSQIPSKQA